MAGSLNRAMIIGNVGNDPKVSRTQDGRPIVNMSVATSETWKDKGTGDRREKTSWHNVVIFNEGLAKVAEDYVRKGSKVYVEGSMQTREWEDQSGAKRYTTEIVLQAFDGKLVLLDGKRDGDERPSSRADTHAERPHREQRAAPATTYDDMDSEIPF